MKKILLLALMAILFASNAFAAGTDVSETPLKFKATSETTAKVIKDKSYKNLESVVIPEKVTIGGKEYSVTAIDRNAFAKCKSLKNIELPSCLTEIGNSAFYNCKSLSNVAIPSKVSSIELGAFAGCMSLTNIVVPESVNNIGNSAFGGCKKLDLVIENSKKNVRVQYDSFTNCKSVKYTK